MIGIATFWLLIALTFGQHKLEATTKDDAARQKNRNTGSGVLIADNQKKQSDGDTAATGQHQGGTGTTTHPAVTPQCFADYVWSRFKALSDADKIASLLLVVTAFYLFATVMIWRQMVESNEHAEKTYSQSKEAAEADRSLLRRQLEAYERPWLTVSIAPSKSDQNSPEQFGFSGDGSAYIWFGLELSNVGKSLATSVTVATRLVALTSAELTHVINLTEKLETAKDHVGQFTLFPGEMNNRLGTRRETPSAEIEAAAFQLALEGAVFVNMALVGRVAYRFATSDDPHHTEFAFLIARRDTRLREVALPFLIVGNQLSSDDVVWIKLPGDHAN